jgi:hypothetical protein
MLSGVSSGPPSPVIGCCIVAASFIDAIIFRVGAHLGQGARGAAARRLRKSAEPRNPGWFRSYQGNSTQMQFDDIILGRRGIRGYKPDPVPKALISEIIGLAMRAPSSMNTQPWNPQ